MWQELKYFAFGVVVGIIGIIALIFGVDWLLYICGGLCIVETAWHVFDGEQNSVFVEVAAVVVGGILAGIFQWGFFLCASAALCIYNVAEMIFFAVMVYF